MKLEKMKNQAEEIGCVLKENYEIYSKDSRFNVCGVSYYWDFDCNGFSSSGDYGDFIEGLFKIAKESSEKILKPRLIVPRTNDKIGYYQMLSMRNHDLVTKKFMELYGSDLELEAIVDDKKQITDAGLDYLGIDLEENGKVTFFDYLINNEGYKGLLERIVIRYERSKDLFASIIDLFEDCVYRDVEQRNNYAIDAKKIKVIPEVTEFLKKYKINSTNSIELDEDIIKPRLILGKRRVKSSQGECCFIDWEEYARKSGSSLRINIDPNEILMQRAVNRIMSDVLVKSNKNINGAIEKVSLMIENSESDTESKALNTTLELLEGINSFDLNKKINHKMVINVKNG